MAGAYTKGPWLKEDRVGRGTWLYTPGGDFVALVCRREGADTTEENATADLIAVAPGMAELIDQLAAMQTEDEHDDGMSGDDAVEALSSLITWARLLLAEAAP